MEDDDALSVWSNEGEERRMTPSFMKDEAVLSELGSVLLDQRSKSHKKMYTEEYLEGQRRTRDNGEEAKLLPLLGENGPEDKWVFECKNTVVSAAISGNCCAWASNDNLIHFASFDKIQKSFKKYDDSIHKVLVTKGMVESLDFSLQNDLSFVAQEIELAVVDFEGWLYIFSFKLEQMVDPSTWTCERRVKHKVKGHASLSCVSMWRGKENSSAYIVVGSSKNPELLIFELKRTSKGAAGLICNGVIQLKGNPLDTQIIPLTKPPKDFDLGYLFCVAVADDSGELNVMEISQQQLLETSTEERLVQTAFSIRLEFTGVELGDMLSASDPDPESDPNPESWNENTKFRIAVACSDLSVYVIEQVYLMPAPKKELRRTSKWRNTPGVSSATDLDAVVALNSWEPIARFEVPAMVLSASISQDGRRVAAAHEGRQVCVYQVDAGCLSHVYECGGGAGARVRCVALGDRHLLMGSFGHAATIVDIHRGLEERLRVRKSRRAQGVTAVALAPAGDLLAVGSRSGRCWVYRVAPDEDPRELYAPAMGNLVHDMVFSDDGEFLAIGDYNGSVDVLVAKDGHSAVSDESRHQFFQCISSDSTGSQKFIWGLSLKSKSIVEQGQEDRGGTQLSKEYILAVACWDGVAHVFILISNHHCHQTSHLTVQELAKIRETGHGSEVEVDSRAYDVSLSNGGRHLVVAWRSGVVRLYDLQAKPEPEQVCDLIKLENREIVWCCALSPKGNLIAVGGLANKVMLFSCGQEGRSELITHWTTGYNVVKLSFLDENTLGAVTTDGMCTIYNTGFNRCMGAILQLKFDDSCTGLSFMQSGGIAVAWGSCVTMLGSATNASGVRDRLSFQLLKERIICDKQCLSVALEASPCLVNSIDIDGESLLYVLVEQGDETLFKIVLDHDEPLGLQMRRKDSAPATALALALANSKKAMLDDMLAAIGDGRIVDSPQIFRFFLSKMDGESNERFLECLGNRFPDSLINFFQQLKLERCEPSVLGKGSFAHVRKPIYLGLPLRSPTGFWGKFLRHFREGREPASTLAAVNLENQREGARNVQVGQAVQSTNVRPEDESPSIVAKTDCISVEAYRIPLDTLCGVYNKDTDHPKLQVFDPLQVLVDASRKLHNYSAFAEGTAVYHLVKFKWGILRDIFRVQYFIFFLYLICTILASWGMIATDGMHRGFIEAWNRGHLSRMSLISSFVLVPWSSYYVAYEAKQFCDTLQLQRRDAPCYRRVYHTFQHHFLHDLWNSIDAFAFSTQLATNVSTLLKPNHLDLRGLAALSSLALFMKIFFFARGFDHWSTYVRMIQNVVSGMFYFVLVNFIILVGFAFAFWIAYSDQDFLADENTSPTISPTSVSNPDNESSGVFSSPWRSLLEVTLIVYGHYNDDLIEYLPNLKLAIALFQLVVLLVNIILINLLVAIMSDAYSEVVKTAAQQVVYEKADLILELERWKSKVFNYSRWVHILEPRDRAAGGVEGGSVLGLGGGGGERTRGRRKTTLRLGDRNDSLFQNAQEERREFE